MLLRVRTPGGHPALTDRLETDLRWQLDFARTVHRELEFSLSVSLLDRKQQSEVGTTLVAHDDCSRPNTRYNGEGEIFRRYWAWD